MNEQAQRHQQATASPSTVFRPERTHLLGAGVMTGILLIAVGASPLKLGWLLVFPLLFVFWVLRSKTVVNDTGIQATYAFRSGRSAKWDSITGVGFRGPKAVVELSSGQPFTLPGVSFQSLPKLEQASRGRIPDALTQGQRAAGEKVVIMRKDGGQVLVSREEYERRQSEQQAAQAPSDDQPSQHS